MNIKGLLKGAATQALKLKAGVNVSKVAAIAREEAHSFAYGVVIKQVLMFSSVFFVIGFLLGCAVTWVLH